MFDNTITFVTNLQISSRMMNIKNITKNEYNKAIIQSQKGKY